MLGIEQQIKKEVADEEKEFLFSKEDVLGLRTHSKAPFLDRAIEAYFAYSATEKVLDLFLSKKTELKKLESLDSAVVRDMKTIFDTSLSSNTGAIPEVFQYLFIEHIIRIPGLVLGRYNRSLRYLYEIKEKYSDVLVANIDWLAKLLNISEVDALKDLEEKTKNEERFPIKYYFLSEGRLRRKTEKYLSAKLALEKFAFDMYIREIVNINITMEEIEKAFNFILGQANINLLIRMNVWDDFTIFLSTAFATVEKKAKKRDRKRKRN